MIRAAIAFLDAYDTMNRTQHINKEIFIHFSFPTPNQNNNNPELISIYLCFQFQSKCLLLVASSIHRHHRSTLEQPVYHMKNKKTPFPFLTSLKIQLLAPSPHPPPLPTP